MKWTKEFLDRIRKSNERHAQNKEKICVVNDKSQNLLNKHHANQGFNELQAREETATVVEPGDAIEMSVFNEDLDSEIELLDYEDDISMDDDHPPVESRGLEEPQPCCSTAQTENAEVNRWPH